MMTDWLKTVSRALAGAALVIAAPAALAGDLPPGVTGHSVSAAYEDVRFDLESAIVNRGLVIDYTSHIGAMLARTSEDVGGTKTIFTNAEAMLFCSAVLSRKVMEADAGNIAYCPYVVFVYETPDAEGEVTVGFRRLAETGSDASRAAIAEINALLEAIVGEAAGE